MQLSPRICQRYRDIAEMQYQRMNGQAKACALTDSQIEEIEIELGNPVMKEVNWNKDDQPRLVQRVVDRCYLSMN